MHVRTVGADLVTRLVADAVRAPSSHNTQPWIFHAHGDVVELWADRTRALPVNDPYDRELVISCGCALLNLRLAAEHAGFAAEVALLPDAAEEDLLARLTLVPAALTLAELALHANIPRRWTHRGRFVDAPVPQAVLRELDAAARHEGAILHVLSEPHERDAAALLVEEGDALLWADARWRRELAMWMHPRRSDDGLPMPGAIVPLARLAVSAVDMGESTGRRDHKRADDSPAIAVLGTAGDATADWLRAGQALQRVLLTAVTHGVQASFLNQPIQVPTLRPRVRTLTAGAGHPQVLLRFGMTAGPPGVTPRRPVADVLNVAVPREIASDDGP
jgi:hypothetical protein